MDERFVLSIDGTDEWTRSDDFCIGAAYETKEAAIRGGCQNCINWISGPDLCAFDLPSGDDLTNCH